MLCYKLNNSSRLSGTMHSIGQLLISYVSFQFSRGYSTWRWSKQVSSWRLCLRWKCCKGPKGILYFCDEVMFTAWFKLKLSILDVFISVQWRLLKPNALENVENKYLVKYHSSEETIARGQRKEKVKAAFISVMKEVVIETHLWFDVI